MPGRKTGSKAVTLRNFLTALVEAAEEGGNLTAVAESLGVTPAAVSARIKSLREKGVTLPTLARTRGGNIAEDARNILSELGVTQN